MNTNGILEDYRYVAVLTIDWDLANKDMQITIADESGVELFVAKNCDRRAAASILKMGIERIVENHGLPCEIAVDFVDCRKQPWLDGRLPWLEKWCLAHGVEARFRPSPWNPTWRNYDKPRGRKADARSATIGMPTPLSGSV